MPYHSPKQSERAVRPLTWNQTFGDITFLPYPSFTHPSTLYIYPLLLIAFPHPAFIRRAPSARVCNVCYTYSVGHSPSSVARKVCQSNLAQAVNVRKS